MKVDEIRTCLKAYDIQDTLAAISLEYLEKLDLYAEAEEVSLLQKGMTNKLILLSGRGHSYLLRFPGEGTSFLINREQEAAVYCAIAGQNISEEVLVFDAKTGLKISKYITNAHTCDPRNKEEVARCMRHLKTVHEGKLTVPHVFDPFSRLQIYEEDCGVYAPPFEDIQETRRQIFSLKGLLAEGEKDRCLCHIDPAYDNLLLDEKKVYLIDWEYAGMCNPCIDLAMFAIYAEYTKDEVDQLIEIYQGQKPTDKVRRTVYAYMAVGAYLWVLWCEVKKISGVDYSEYEQGQYAIAKIFYRYAMDIDKKIPNHKED